MGNIRFYTFQRVNVNAFARCRHLCTSSGITTVCMVNKRFSLRDRVNSTCDLTAGIWCSQLITREARNVFSEFEVSSTVHSELNGSNRRTEGQKDCRIP